MQPEVQDLRVYREFKVFLVILGHKVLQEQPVAKVPQVLQDHRVQLDPKGQLDLRVLRVV